MFLKIQARLVFVEAHTTRLEHHEKRCEHGHNDEREAEHNQL